MPLTLERRAEIRRKIRREFAVKILKNVQSSVTPPDYDEDDFTPSLNSVGDFDPPGKLEAPSIPVPQIIDLGKPHGRKRSCLILSLFTCDQMPGRRFTAREAAELEGVTPSAIYNATRQVARTKKGKIKNRWRMVGIE